ncbi:CehA/McbA family metallohydrolase [Myxococcota bacterium]
MTNIASQRLRTALARSSVLATFCVAIGQTACGSGVIGDFQPCEECRKSATRGPDKDIVRFVLQGNDAIIDTDTISLTVPSGTPLLGLTPVIWHTGASVTPACGEPQDFTETVHYTVIAGDASTKSYAVTVTVETRIDNPYMGHEYWCKGALHLHTTESDGGSTPASMAEAYKSHGFDFLFITDHNILTEENSVSGISVFGGEEVSTTDGHSNALGISTYVEPWQSRQDTIDEVVSQGGLLQANHPTRYGCTKEHLDGLVGLWGIEVRNQPHFQPEDLVLWDGQISQGKRLWGTFSDDAHGTGGVGRGWVMVNSEDSACTLDAVIANLAAGNFYGSEGPNMDIAVIGDSVVVVSDTATKIEWYQQDITLVQSTHDASDTYHLTGEEVFVRVVVTDADEKMAWSQPLFLTDAP